ncbi:MAG: cytochrome c oxidase subunit II [Anaerolineae bacterium]|nr:cytochrome c oxidase subunit II [Anaerolineae bacterium]
MRLFWVKKGHFLAILVASLALFLSGCATGLPQDMLTPNSPAAQDTASLFYLIFWISVVVFILVEGLLVWFVLRYQRRAHDEHPEQYHGNTSLEITWTVIPALILIVVFALTLRTMGTTGATQAPGQGIPITVAGHQWWWEIQYNDGQIKTASELHMPSNQVMNLTLISENVIHSFWVPRLMGKTDTMPGHQNQTWLYTSELGSYDGQCAEFCGNQHANMLFRVIVQSPQEFEAWLANQAAPPVEPASGTLEAHGKELITNPQYFCTTCHTIQGTPAVGVTGPNLTHFASRGCFAGCMFENNTENLTAWLTNSNALKPGNIMAKTLAQRNPQDPNHPLTPDEVQALVAYLSSLK